MYIDLGWWATCSRNSNTIFICFYLFFKLYQIIWSYTCIHVQEVLFFRFPIQGVASSVLESCGVSLIAVCVLSKVTSLSGISVMNGVFLVPILIHVFINAKRPGSKHFLITMVLALIMELAGLVFIILSVHQSGESHKDDFITLSNSWQLFLALVSISLAWTPWVQRQQLYPSKAKFRQLYNEMKDVHGWPGKHDHVPMEITQNDTFADNTNATSGYGGSSGSGRSGRTISSRVSSTSSSEEGNHSVVADDDSWIDKHRDIIFGEPTLSSRWKNGFICSLIKLIFIPGFSMLWGYIFNIYKVDSLHAGIQHVNENSPVFIPFMVNIFASFGGYILGCAACSMAVQKVSFALPLVLVTPLLIVILMTTNVCEKLFENAKFECGAGNTTMLQVYSYLGAACLYLAQILSTSYFIFKTQTAVLQKEANVSVNSRLFRVLI